MPEQRRRAGMVLPLLGILLVAINLRPAITSVGPVLPLLGDDLALDASALGLLGALPVAVFGIVAVVVAPLVQRFGVERTTAGALALLTVATVLRSWPGPSANLWIGTVLIGAAIAVGNVVVPVIVKTSFPRSTALVTAVYVAVLGIFAGLAAALAVPLAEGSRLSWRFSLGVWAILTFAGLCFWTARALRARSPGAGGVLPVGAAGSASAERPAHPALTEQRAQEAQKAGGAGVWRRATAWQISVYMGVQSSVFYVALTWLPTVEQELGVDPVAAGWHMFILQVAGVVGNLAAPALMRIGGDQRVAAVLPGIAHLVGLAGIVFAPGLIVLWVAILGLGTGSAFVVALSLIAMRAHDLTTAGHLSSMAQAVGYVIAGLALFVAGPVQSWNSLAVLGVIALVAVGVLVSGALAGRHRMLTPREVTPQQSD
ncbi:MFS transporter [Pseudactinotalea sp. HY160]|uniref:MFS transporter n=1 Tax=Pseudactinotalea sp. HY160 TaxID=2654490 RepID=UPI00128C6CED|nr:MFS transporter [Pseudactinotalea sp. HY160]MPV50556.1 MFS transporter [Pseudactinotalea sp. HY160]